MLASAFHNLSSALAVLRRGAISDALFFDETTYRLENEDVADSVDAGLLHSFYDHWVRYGRWEGRRFTLRRFGLSHARALRLLAGAATLERHLDTLACRFAWGELAHRLRTPSGARLVKPVGPCKHELHPGPWRAPLPLTPTEFCMLKVKVVPVRAPLAFRLRHRDLTPLGDPVAMFCRPTRSVQRLLRVPPGAHWLDIELLDQRLRTQPLRVALKPVADRAVEQRMLRRLVHHHRRFLGRHEKEVMHSLQRDARDAQLPLRAIMWRAYESTFPPPVAEASYQSWIDTVEKPHLASLRLAQLAAHPRISVLVPVFNPAAAHLRACIDSVLAQSYPHWELCLVDDASTAPHVRALLDDYASRDARIRIAFRSERGHVCRASKDALAMATGELVALLDHDDVLPVHALLHVARAIASHPEAELFYSDEDKLATDDVREDPHFKPAFDPELLLGQNYLGHLLVARTSRVREVGGFRPGYEGSQDHDLVLRLTETIRADRIVHIPHVLYHWRKSAQSTASSSAAKPYTLESGLAAVRDALRRRGEDADIEHADVPHCYRVIPRLVEPPPVVSVVVPTRDAVRLLSTCIDTLRSRTDYPRYEIIVVDNGSRDSAALAYLKRIETEVRVLRDPRPFNFSALVNLGARHATGTLLALLNNDVEVVAGDWLRQLVAQAARPGVGCVGAKLLYPDGTIQHAGVLLGLHGLAGHPYRHLSAHHPGYFGRLTVTHAVSAVTAACLVVQKRIYDEVGGFDEDIAVAFNDVDFCLRVRRAGYRNLLVPHAVLVHHESATRGLDQDGDKRRRFLREVDIVKRRWADVIADDPCYSPHLSLDHEDYSIRVAH